MEGQITLDSIYHEDCLTGMKRIKDASIDFILTDLPFGTTHNSWDKIIPFEPMWEQFNRVIKPNGAIALWSQQPFSSKLICSNPKMFRYEWIIEKSLGTGFLNANKMPMKCHENILIFYKSLPTFNAIKTPGLPYAMKKGAFSSNYGKYKATITENVGGYRYPRDVLHFNTAVRHPMKGLQGHPTGKNVDICEYFIKTYTNPGEIVLDACMGSGSTAIACLNLKRHFIGFETDDGIYQKSIRRLDSWKYEGDLFNDLYS